MTSPSPNPPPTGPDRSSGPTPQKPQPQAWGLNQQQQPSRRGLTPISTSFSQATSQPQAQSQSQSQSQAQQRPASSSQSPVPRNPWSPIAAATLNTTSLSAVANSRQSVRSSSISASTSPFSPPPGGSQQQPPTSQLLSSGRSRTIASTTNPQLASAAAASQATGGGAGSGGGSSTRFRASPSLSSPSFGSPTIPATSNAGATAATSATAAAPAGKTGSLTQIVIAQLFLLLSTIKEDKDKTKWETEAEKIRKLVDSHGMDVYTKYFRRLLANNASQIWGPNRGGDVSGNYQILVSEVQKVTHDLAQSLKIVESVENGEGEIFKDFDLSTFMEHFRMTPLGKIILASAFKRSSKSDLRTKADAIISNNIQNFLSSVANPNPAQPPDHDEEILYATVIDRLAQDPPRNWNSELQQGLVKALEKRFHSAGVLVPIEISSTLNLFDLVTASNSLVRLVQKVGPKGTESVEASKAILEGVDMREIGYQQVASALLFMVTARDEPPYEPTNFLSALREHRGGQRLDWQDIVHAFDREGLKITKQQFKRLFDTLMPLAQDYENFDIQLLWGGDWRHEETQLAFTSAFLSFSEDELDASQIPRLRTAFTLEDFADASEEIKAYADRAVRHPLVSIDATKALFNLVFQSSDTYTHAQSFGVVDNIINPKMDLFVGSVSAVPKPWGALQDQAIRQLVSTLFFQSVSGHGFALHLLWKRDSSWLSARLYQLYQHNPMQLVSILDLAQEHRWLNELIGANNELSLDLAALAHGRQLFDIETWLHQITQSMQRERVVPALCTFLNNKIEDDVAAQKDKIQPRTVPLTVRTAHAILTFLGSEGLPESERTQLQRAAITAYPRIVNYGEGFDEIIDANGQNGNGLSPEADAKMQEHYKQMYSGESQVRDIIEVLQRYKSSQEPADQDLFACMIFGLFDEYNCFGEYPLDALATTAVLFGSIINFNLLSKVALQVAISMVLEAVREYQPHESMYKFGLQALINFQDRLDEWSRLSETLLEIPGLQGTPIYPVLERISRDKQDVPNGEQSETDGAGGAADDFLGGEPSVPEFNCLSVDPPLRPDFYTEPDEQVQEVVLFILNNVSERNLDDKCADLRTKLTEEHHQWFANYLVESRIKPQPNYHQLYMDLLYKLEDRNLWSEVLRETFVSCIRMLNSESTMNSSNERSHLKNLGSWLGSMTLAQNQTIRHRNISFKDLLNEGHSTQRLLVVIPFVCKVLSTASQSPLFRPPCAWTMEIVAILIELYQFTELKLNLKFEVEVLCKTLGLNHKDVEPADVIRSRPQEEEMLPTSVSDGMEGFNDLSLINLARPRGMTDRFSRTNIIPQLPELSSILKHNYTLPPASLPIQNKIRHLLTEAVERAVSEIIGPVVERSVTIAAIAASQLIAKDFALEPDENKYRESAHKSVRSLAGSLAGVTCKEPLRTSMQNNIQHMRQELPEQTLPQGSILMFVNDNLDSVCNIVEKAAESASMSEIDTQIADPIQARQRQTFVEPQLSRWAYYIPDPFKPTQGGLNPEQLAIYEDFSRTARGHVVQSSNAPQESGRQIPDILQDQFPSSFPGAGDPSLAPTTSHHGVGDHPGGSAQSMSGQPLVNGYVNGQSLNERILDLVNALFEAADEAAREESDRHLAESTGVKDAWTHLRDQLVAAGPMQRDMVAITAAAEIGRHLYAAPLKTKVLELLAQILRKMCDFSDTTAQAVYTWCMNPAEDRMFNAPVTAALVKSELMDVHRVDLVTSSALHDRKPGALEFFRDLVDEVLLVDPPAALRADLANSIVALTQLISMDRNLTIGYEISRKLQDSEAEVASIQDEGRGANRQSQFQYIFDEWVRLQTNDTPPASLVIFAQQLHARGMLSKQEDSVDFLRICVDSSVLFFEQQQQIRGGNPEDAFFKIDAFAKLIVLFVLHQGKLNSAAKPEKVAFFESTVSVLALIFSQQYQKRGDMVNQKVFFRLFSSLICELQHVFPLGFSDSSEMYQESMHALGKCLAMLQPKNFPGFAFSWLSLISHRLFIPGLLKGTEEGGRSVYCELLSMQLAYVGELMKAMEVDITSRDYYRGTLKLLLILHHDFPEFLAEYHVQLLKSIPSNCTQMRSLIVSASPGSFPDFPDPFHEGLKVDRQDDSRRAPIIRGEFDKSPKTEKALAAVDEYLRSSEPQDEHLNLIVQAICDPVQAETGIGYADVPVDAGLLNDLVVYIVQQAEAASRPRPLSYSAGSPTGRLLEALLDRLSPEPRYYLLSAIANQLRYPNSHTHYFCYAIFHLWRTDRTDRQAMDVKQQIVRVLLERIVVHRPHPWGLIVTMLELLKNRSYGLWDAPFVKHVPEVERTLTSLLQQMAQNARAMA